MQKDKYVEFNIKDYRIFTTEFVYVKLFPSDFYKIIHFDEKGVYINQTYIPYNNALDKISFINNDIFGKIEK